MMKFFFVDGPDAFQFHWKDVRKPPSFFPRGKLEVLGWCFAVLFPSTESLKCTFKRKNKSVILKLLEMICCH